MWIAREFWSNLSQDEAFSAFLYIARGNNAVGNPANNRPVQKWTLKKVEEPSL